MPDTHPPVGSIFGWTGLSNMIPPGYWRSPVAISVALAVLVACSVPVRALPGTKSVGKVPASTAIPQAQDPGDDDDLLSGGELAMWLQAVGGAAAGVLYESPHYTQGGKQYPSLTFKKTCSNTTRVTMDQSDVTGKTSHSEWTAGTDQSSRMIKLTKNKTDGAGRRTHSEWKGNLDGRFYRLKGDPKADELSYAIDGPKLVVTAKKAGRVTLTNQIAASATGRSFTTSMNGVSRVFSASGDASEIPNMGRAPKQADGVGRLDLRVVDQDGNPVQGVRADLQSTLADGSLCESWNRTDACGISVLPPLHMGKLTLTLTANGYETQQLQFNAADLDQPVRVGLHKK